MRTELFGMIIWRTKSALLDDRLGTTRARLLGWNDDLANTYLAGADLCLCVAPGMRIEIRKSLPGHDM